MAIFFYLPQKVKGRALRGQITSKIQSLIQKEIKHGEAVRERKTGEKERSKNKYNINQEEIMNRET